MILSAFTIEQLVKYFYSMKVSLVEISKGCIERAGVVESCRVFVTPHLLVGNG